MNETGIHITRRNWRSRHDVLGKPIEGVYDREEEGRRPIWRAHVERQADGWWGIVRRYPGSRHYRVGWGVGSDEIPTGQWTFGIFSTPENAIDFTEWWVNARRTPATWRDGTHPCFPVGDRYELKTTAEEALLQWARAAPAPPPPVAFESTSDATARAEPRGDALLGLTPGEWNAVLTALKNVERQMAAEPLLRDTPDFYLLLQAQAQLTRALEEAP